MQVSGSSKSLSSGQKQIGNEGYTKDRAHTVPPLDILLASSYLQLGNFFSQKST